MDLKVITLSLYILKFNTISVVGKCIFSNEKIKKVKNMLGPHCNGTLMYSSESEIVRNDAFLSKLEEKVDKHNNLVERMSTLELRNKVCEHRIENLEKKAS